jgi:protoporphyrinogen oxidase
MGIYDYIIVGGGISGLFMAYKLSETGKSILVVESTNRVGGRIYTKEYKGVPYELGAARISSNHKKVLSLLHELKLQDDLVKLSDTITYKLSRSTINFYSLVKEIVEGAKLYSTSYLQSINLLQLCIDVLGQDKATLFQHTLGYDSEFIHLNAHQALKSYKKDLFSGCDYFILKKGMSSMIDALHKKLIERDNVKIKLEVSVTDIGKNYIQIDKKKKYGSHILCCVPYQTLQSFSKMKAVPEIHAVQPIPLMRIYAKYPKDKDGYVWFKKINRTITNKYIRHIIPIDPEAGLIMISYTDGTYADMWSNLSKISNKVLIDHLHAEIKEVLGIEPPKPEFLTHYHWSAGVHMWKPGYNVYDVYKKLLKPFPNEPIYIVNEAYSKHQCWIEGCLEACYDAIELLEGDFKRGVPASKGGSKRVSKIYTIKEVLKNRNWIVLDIKDQLRIYDVSKWLKYHPGGASNLKLGIQANKHYIDKEKHPKSPIDLFKEIDTHISGKVIETMLLKGTDKITYIGIMKKV